MASEARYKLLYNDVDYYYFWSVSIEAFSWTVAAIPFLAFLFCIGFSIVYNFESATKTHCHTMNFAPSISAAIGNYSPQKEVWKIAILVQMLPRLCMALIYHQQHREVLYSWAAFINTVAWMCNVIENVALVVLSLWTSSEHYHVHKTAFAIFILSSETYMLLLLIMHTRCRRAHLSKIDLKSLRWKKRLLLCNLTCIITAVYFFVRHNTWCEHFVYSYFAIFEYGVVLSNMAFHVTAFLDFKGKQLFFTPRGVTLEYKN